MRPRALALVAAALAAGCGGGRTAGTLDDLSKHGETVSLIAGDADFAPGVVRYSFLVVGRDGRPVASPTARIFVARGLNEKPFATSSAVLEPVGLGRQSEAGDVTHLYVTRVRLPAPGKYWLLADPAGTTVHGLGNLIVTSRSASPAVDAKAYPSDTPTLASAHGQTKPLTTRVPPDRGLLRYSVAGSLAAHAPFVLVFATPAFCQSRTCGPVVDVVDHVRRQYEPRGIRFIHVEIYRNNNTRRGENRWVKEWKLPSEPWVFLVGRDGRIRAKFEGSVSADELAAAVRAHLLR